MCTKSCVPLPDLTSSSLEHPCMTSSAIHIAAATSFSGGNCRHSVVRKLRQRGTPSCARQRRVHVSKTCTGDGPRHLPVVEDDARAAVQLLVPLKIDQRFDLLKEQPVGRGVSGVRLA